MKKKRHTRQNQTHTTDFSITDHHDFTDSEVANIRLKLLSWYDSNKRSLPWRALAQDIDINKRSYAVWVSEIMLQQTQVATVIDYYNRWMTKWPRVEDLAKASLEEINEMWSGLGYYSRAKRLHEGAKKVVNELKGQVPRNAAQLLADLPGVGRYTSSAIASIAFNEVTGLVDGNVVRVLSRLRTIGADSTSNEAVKKYWELANKLVDSERPGDFNQALMEFGATLCMPKSPSCEMCPLREVCLAFKQVSNEKTRATERLLLSEKSVAEQGVTRCDDIEDCSLCLPKDKPWDSLKGVENYPRKPQKKQAKEQMIAVTILEFSGGTEVKYLIVQRPDKGLLAGLWEFPNIIIEKDWTESEVISRMSYVLKEEMLLESNNISSTKRLGEVNHVFSHIHHNYVVHCCCYSNTDIAPLSASGRSCRWITRQEFQDAAVSTAMRKVFRMYEKNTNKCSKISGEKVRESRKRKREHSEDGKKQASISCFFKPNL